MPGDATPSSPVTKSVTQYDITFMDILPLSSLIRYGLRITWSNGETEQRENVVKPSDFVAALGSFCQASPKNKFLTWLKNNGYESNLTVS